MLTFRADRGAWLTIICTVIGLITIIAGQFPYPTTDGWVVAKGSFARIGGLGFLGLALSFWGVFSFTESTYQMLVHRFLAKVGLVIFAFCLLYMAHDLLGLDESLRINPPTE